MVADYCGKRLANWRGDHNAVWGMFTRKSSSTGRRRRYQISKMCFFGTAGNVTFVRWIRRHRRRRSVSKSGMSKCHGSQLFHQRCCIGKHNNHILTSLANASDEVMVAGDVQGHRINEKQSVLLLPFLPFSFPLISSLFPFQPKPPLGGQLDGLLSHWQPAFCK